jgi:hypothetical protein
VAETPRLSTLGPSEAQAPGCMCPHTSTGGRHNPVGPLRERRRIQGLVLLYNSDLQFLSARRAVFFAGLQDGSIFIMYRSTLKVLGTLNGHTRAVLAMVSVGEILISGSEDGDIRAWDISSDSRLGPDRCKRVLQAHHGGVTCLAVAGNRLMSGGHDWSACVWRVTGHGAEWSCRLDFELDQRQSSVVSLVTFEDKLVTGSRDHSILVWNLKRHKVEQELVGHTGGRPYRRGACHGGHGASSARRRIRPRGCGRLPRAHASRRCRPTPPARPSASRRWRSAGRCCSGGRTGSPYGCAGLKCGCGT